MNGIELLNATGLNMNLLAQAAGDKAPPAFMQFIPFILIIVMFYFMLIRPQQKRQKEHKAMVDAIKSGDKVVAAGGIHGVISNIKDNVVVLKIADNVKIEVDRASISTVTKTDGESK